MKVITNAKIITESEILEGYHLLFDEKIIDITSTLPQNATVIDAKGAYLSAGFIDIHIHGSSGADVMDATPEALERIAQTIVQTGTTAFLGTTMTMAAADITKALENVQRYPPKTGAKLLGVHLEGPFINPNKHGAQNRDFIQSPDMSLIAPYMDIVKMITLAPEVQGAEAFIRYLNKHYPHILLSIGHSEASYAESIESFEWGVSHATHLFNAMNPLHHREPGIVGAVLADPEVSCDIIADLVHIHPSFFPLLRQLKPDNLVLITDAIRAGCLQSGNYMLGGQEVIVDKGIARLADGTLAGSLLKLNEALRNFDQHSDMTLVELIAMVTTIPARKLGLKMGRLAEGYPADMVLFDSHFTIHQTWVNGELIFDFSV